MWTRRRGGGIMKLVSRNSRCEERMGIMTREGMINQVIEEYAKLQRIINAEDPKKEAMNQKHYAEAKLQAFGIVTEKLELE